MAYLLSLPLGSSSTAPVPAQDPLPTQGSLPAQSPLFLRARALPDPPVPFLGLLLDTGLMHPYRRGTETSGIRTSAGLFATCICKYKQCASVRC